MTKIEVVEAAYRVWGRELYQNTSLSHVARELNVCKPALYRHFINKHALLEAMTMHFFDDFAGFIHENYEKSLKNEDQSEKLFILIRSVLEYYARNANLLIFSVARLHDSRLTGLDMHKELCKRGVDFPLFLRSIKEHYAFDTLVMRLIFASLVFYMAGFHNFHKTQRSPVNPPSEEAIARVIDEISNIVKSGLGYSAEDIQTIDFMRLENLISGTVNSIEDDPLLRAVAGAVADAGPWEASMEQVARRSGLAKSSLYSHFKSKKDMLHQLFMTESMRIINFSKQGMKQSEVPLEQLYLGIFSIAEYLRSRPDIMVCLDWVRNRRLEFRPSDDEYKEPPVDFLQLFEGIGIKPLQYGKNAFRGGAEEIDNPGVSPWIIFLIIKTLMTKDPDQVPNNDIRTLFRFITMGIGGFKQVRSEE